MSKYINGLKIQDCTTEFLYLHSDTSYVAVLVSLSINLKSQKHLQNAI